MRHDEGGAANAPAPAGTGHRPDAPAHLRALGIGPAEEAAYELLLGLPAADAGELAARWTRPEDLATTLGDLVARGLAERLPGTVPRYAAVPPTAALDGLLAEQERHLARTRDHVAELTALYHRHRSAPGPGTVVEVVTGREAVLQRTAQILWSAREEVRRLDDAAQPRTEGDLSREIQRLRAGVASRVIYPGAALEQRDALPWAEELVRAGQRARTLPTVPMRLHLADRRYAVLPLLHREDGSRPAADDREGAAEAIVVVHPSALLDALSGLFDNLWERALPLPLEGGDGTVARTHGRSGEPEQADGRLLALLLLGLTDQAGARQLGVSHRTVQRRVADLLDELGARTRFQAGARLALRDLPRRTTETGDENGTENGTESDNGTRNKPEPETGNGPRNEAGTRNGTGPRNKPEPDTRNETVAPG